MASIDSALRRLEDADRGQLQLVVARVANGSRQKAIKECVEIVQAAKADFKSTEATLILREIERLMLILAQTGNVTLSEIST